MTEHDSDRPACSCCGRRIGPLDDTGRCGLCGANRDGRSHVGDEPCNLGRSTYTPDPAEPPYDRELMAVVHAAALRAIHEYEVMWRNAYADAPTDRHVHQATAVMNAVLPALTESGRVLPADAESRTEWTVKVNGNVMEAYAGITTEANCRAIAADPPFEGHEVIVVSRFAARGPWLPAPTTKES